MELRRFFLALLPCLLAGMMQVSAQIPAEVRPILERAERWFDDKDGLDVSMTGKVLAVKMSMRSRTKGDKFLMSMQMSVMGKNIEALMGTDGKRSWMYDSANATLTISDSVIKPKDDGAIDLKLVSEYKKAKMKTTDDAYEITLTEPKDKENPGKMVLTVRRSDCMPTAMELGSGLKKVSMTIESIKKGVPDDVFVLDTTKFQGAKIIRK